MTDDFCLPRFRSYCVSAINFCQSGISTDHKCLRPEKNSFEIFTTIFIIIHLPTMSNDARRIPFIYGMWFNIPNIFIYIFFCCESPFDESHISKACHLGRVIFNNKKMIIYIGILLLCLGHLPKEWDVVDRMLMTEKCVYMWGFVWFLSSSSS